LKIVKIVTGYKYHDYRIVESGLKANDKVVIDAIQKVGSGMAVVPKITKFESKATKQ